MVKRALQIVALLGTLLVGAAAMAVIVTQTAWFKDWLRGFIVRQANDYLNGRLTIGRLGGNLFFGVELQDVDVRMGGRPVVSVKDVGVDYSIFSLLGGGVVLDDIRINRPTLHLQKTEDGWNLGGLVKARAKEADREGPGRAISIGEIGVTDGTLVVEGAVGTSGVGVPSRVEKLNATVGFEYDPVNYTIDIGHLSFAVPEQDFRLNDFSGRIATREDAVFVENLAVRTAESSLRIDGAVQSYRSKPSLDLRVSSDRLTLQEIARVVPALAGYQLQPAFEIDAKGTLDDLRLDLNVRSGAGMIVGDVRADLSQPGRRIRGDLDLQHLDLAPILRNAAQRSDITGRAVVDLRLTNRTGPNPLAAIDGTWKIVAPRVAILGYEARDIDASGRIDDGVLHLDGRAAAYGGRATVAGRIVPAAPLRLDLRGEARGIDLRNLPPSLKVPGAPSDLNLSYRLEGTPAAVTADVAFRESRLAGATIEAGSTAGVTTGAVLRYRSNATVRELDLQQIGRAFGIAALAGERYQSAVNGTFDVSGEGTKLETMALTARGTLVDSALFGGRVPQLAFDTSLQQRALQLTARGRFAGFDPGALTGRANLAGEIAGAVDLTAGIANISSPADPAGLRADGTIALAQSRVGEIVLERATVDGTYADSVGNIRQLLIEGPDVSVDAKGRLDLRQGGASDLAYTADVGNLATIGKMVGTEMAGSVTAEGRLTGSAEALSTTGTAAVSNFAYGDTRVLSVKSKYDVQIPDLQPARAAVTADTTASLIEVAGQSLTEVSARTTWKDQSLEFDGTVRDPNRSLDLAGNVVLHPDHQEVHLRNLALRTEGVEWRTEPGNEAAVQYGGGRTVIEGMRLVSGAQRLTVDGGFGQSGDRLVVQATAIDLAQVDALLLGQQRMGGTLNATATVVGTREMPQASAEFTIERGSFRQFVYNDFRGTAEYGPGGVRFDTKLTQTPDAWIAAKGFVPAAVFNPGGERAEEAAGHELPPKGEGLDVAVTSSALDLGLVQGFVPQMSEVSGTLQADVRVTGSARDPHLEGYVDVRNGAFTVADLTKGGYTGLDTRIELTPDRVQIREFTILDEHRSPLRISGGLAFHQRQVGAVEIGIKATQFEVIDNQLADVKLNTDIRVTGDLRQPRVEGALSVHTGTIHLDRVLAMTTTDAYATEPAPLETQAPQDQAARQAAAESQQQPGQSPQPGAVAAPAPGTATADAPSMADAGPGDRGAGGANAQEAEEPTAFENLALDVTVKMPNNLVVKGSDLNPGGGAPIGLGDVNVTLGGDIHAVKSPGGDVRLTGVVNTVRGTYDFQGRRFELARDGRVTFQGTSDYNPRLDITATRLISGVEAIVHVRGTAKAPELTLSSRPPLDQADVLSLIIFNQPANALGEGQQVSLAQRASALATGFVASSLARSIGGALELDVFEIQTTPETGATPTVTLGEQVGERLFFKFRQAFGASAASEFILEYQLAEFLRLQTSFAEGGGASERTLMRRVEQGGIDLIFYYAY